MAKGQTKKPALHHQIAAVLRQEIAQAKPGHRLEPLTALAARFRVSPISVRNAWLLLSHEGLVELRHGSGCYVQQRPVDRHVGLFIDWDLSVSDSAYFFLRAMQELRRFFSERGHRARFYIGTVRPGEEAVGLSCAEFLEDVTADKLSGVAVLATPEHPRWGEPLRQRGIPVVGMNWYPYPYSVGLDESGILVRGVQHLAEQGCRKVALMGWGATTPGLDTRYNTFQGAMAAQHLPIHPAWLRCDLHPWLEAAGWEEFRELWMAQAEKPDGLLICDDNLYRGAAAAMLELGVRVPEQLRVVTHANKGSGMLYPVAAARLEFDPSAFALQMGQMLWRQMQGEPDGPHRVVIPFAWQPESACGPKVRAEAQTVSRSEKLVS